MPGGRAPGSAGVVAVVGVAWGPAGPPPGAGGSPPMGPGGALAQPASRASAASRAGTATHNRPMWLVLLEALGALVLLVFIVWWTMFSGRRSGERRSDDEPRT